MKYSFTIKREMLAASVNAKCLILMANVINLDFQYNLKNKSQLKHDSLLSSLAYSKCIFCVSMKILNHKYLISCIQKLKYIVENQ